MPKCSVTIVTLNEAAHIAAAIDSVSWADEVLVVDCGSHDTTTEIARAKGATVLHRDWSGWIDQKNFAADRASNDWIFSLDADERVPPPLAGEIRELLSGEPPMHGYRVPRVTFHLGKWIRTTDFYPDYQTRLYDRRAARWDGKYVHESVSVEGPVGRFRHDLEHYSFRDLTDHLDRVNHYTTLAARQMHESGRRAGLFDLTIHPAAAFVRNYLLRLGMLDGTPGLIISVVNAYSVFLKFAKLRELQQTPTSQSPKPNQSSS
jgi:glycosyltransferase involved in cell wall biosynthesis